MTDKEKINNLICCILFASAEYENQIIMYKNSFEIHKSTDPYLILDLYKAQCKYEAYKELSVKIEKILFIFNRLPFYMQKTCKLHNLQGFIHLYYLSLFGYVFFIIQHQFAVFFGIFYKFIISQMQIY